MKKQIFSLMALLVFTSPCLGQNPKIVEFPNIYLNTNTINQRTITYKNEKSGAKDLQTIASLEDYEQGWVFIQNYKIGFFANNFQYEMLFYYSLNL